MRKQRTPAELTHFIPEPIVILFGCRPLVPFQSGWHDRPSHDQHYHAPERAAHAGDRPWPTELCPVCRGRIGRRIAGAESAEFLAEIDHRTYCGLCGSMDPHNEANAVAQRIDDRSRLRHEEVARQIKHALNDEAEANRRRPRLSEADRRRIWNGYKGGILAANLEVTNRARIGREFLTRIKQEPDWSLILDAGGKIVGRHAPPPSVE
jgi:hypothetical protein